MRQEYPDLDSHYSLFVWIEGEFHRLDGCYHERNLWTRVTAVISPRPGGYSTVGVHTIHAVDMREFVERELAECG